MSGSGEVRQFFFFVYVDLWFTYPRRGGERGEKEKERQRQRQRDREKFPQNR